MRTPSYFLFLTTLLLATVSSLSFEPLHALTTSNEVRFSAGTCGLIISTSYIQDNLFSNTSDNFQSPLTYSSIPLSSEKVVDQTFDLYSKRFLILTLDIPGKSYGLYISKNQNPDISTLSNANSPLSSWLRFEISPPFFPSSVSPHRISYDYNNFYISTTRTVQNQFKIGIFVKYPFYQNFPESSIEISKWVSHSIPQQDKLPIKISIPQMSNIPKDPTYHVNRTVFLLISKDYIQYLVLNDTALFEDISPLVFPSAFPLTPCLGLCFPECSDIDVQGTMNDLTLKFNCIQSIGNSSSSFASQINLLNNSLSQTYETNAHSTEWPIGPPAYISSFNNEFFHSFFFVHNSSSLAIYHSENHSYSFIPALFMTNISLNSPSFSQIYPILTQPFMKYSMLTQFQPSQVLTAFFSISQDPNASLPVYSCSESSTLLSECNCFLPSFPSISSSGKNPLDGSNPLFIFFMVSTIVGVFSLILASAGIIRHKSIKSRDKSPKRTSSVAQLHQFSSSPEIEVIADNFTSPNPLSSSTFHNDSSTPKSLFHNIHNKITSHGRQQSRPALLEPRLVTTDSDLSDHFA